MANERPGSFAGGETFHQRSPKGRETGKTGERHLAAGVREETCAAEQKTEEEVVEKPVHILDFRVHATAEQLTGLRRYLKENGIRFERVPEK